MVNLETLLMGLLDEHDMRTVRRGLPVTGKVCIVHLIPECDFDCELPGIFDFCESSSGRWAHGCEGHWLMHRVAPTIGTGRGQLWVTREQLDAAVHMPPRKHVGAPRALCWCGATH